MKQNVEIPKGKDVKFIGGVLKLVDKEKPSTWINVWKNGKTKSYLSKEEAEKEAEERKTEVLGTFQVSDVTEDIEKEEKPIKKKKKRLDLDLSSWSWLPIFLGILCVIGLVWLFFNDSLGDKGSLIAMSILILGAIITFILGNKYKK